MQPLFSSFSLAFMLSFYTELYFNIFCKKFNDCKKYLNIKKVYKKL